MTPRACDDDECASTDNTVALLSSLAREIVDMRTKLLDREENVVRRTTITMNLNMAMGFVLRARTIVERQLANERRRVS